MSKRLTLAQVTAQLEAANAAYERIASERDSLRAECAQLTEQLIAAEMRANEALRAKAPAPRTSRVHTFEYGNKDSFLAAMNAARQHGGVVRRAA